MFVVYCVNIINQQQGNLDEIHALNEQLQDVNEQLQEYSVMAEKMAETRERNRLAREIHDTLGHTLTGIAAGIDACLATIGTSPRQTKDQLELISKVTRDGIKEIRRSVSQLRPDALERFSLEYAISKMVSDMNAVSGARVYFDCQVKNLKFDEDEKCHLQGYPGGNHQCAAPWSCQPDMDYHKEGGYGYPSANKGQRNRMQGDKKRIRNKAYEGED